jgi:Tfp pilus assembly major pilin PilA
MRILGPQLVKNRPHPESGFSTIELMVVLVILMVSAAVTIPGYLSMTRYLRITGDGRDLSGGIAGAKMRAAQDFTHARLHADLANNTFQLEVWNKNAACWQTDGDVGNPCTVAGSPVQPLSQGVLFGLAAVGAGAPNPQAVVAQAPACLVGVAGGGNLATIANTACIEFNSRGLPVAADGSPTANDAIYITNNNTVYGTTVIVSGLIQSWSSPAAATAWGAR